MQSVSIAIAVLGFIGAYINFCLKQPELFLKLRPALDTTCSYIMVALMGATLVAVGMSAFVDRALTPLLLTSKIDAQTIHSITDPLSQASYWLLALGFLLPFTVWPMLAAGSYLARHSIAVARARSHVKEDLTD